MWHVIRKHAQFLLGWGVLIALVSLGISLLFPKQYSAQSKVVIISRDRGGIDPFTQAKSAERIGEHLAQVMTTTDFRDKVVAGHPALFQSKQWTELSERQWRKRWTRDIEAHMIFGGSLLQITAFGSTGQEAAALSDAVTQTVVESGWEYIGGDVAIKPVDTALTSRWPVRPNWALNAAVGFVVGVLLSGLWVVRYRQHHLFGRG